ncbi:MAG: DUF4412 domain-containing protein [Verrucomicrobiota bacterium]
MRPFLPAFSLFLALCSQLFAFDGDITMESVMGGQAVNSTFVAKGAKVKVSPPGGMGTVIIDRSTDDVYILMDAQRMYMKRPMDSLQAPQPDGEITDSGETDEILGYPVRKLVFTEASGNYTEIWATTEIKNEALNNMPGVNQKMLDQIEAVFGTSEILPLKTVTHNKDGVVLNAMTVTAITPREVSDAEVSIPEGYTEFEMPAGAPVAPGQ